MYFWFHLKVNTWGKNIKSGFQKPVINKIIKYFAISVANTPKTQIFMEEEPQGITYLWRLTKGNNHKSAHRKLTINWVNVEDTPGWWHNSVGNLPILPRVTVSGCYCNDCTACWEVLWYSYLLRNTQYGQVYPLEITPKHDISLTCGSKWRCKAKCVMVAVPDTCLE